jgi:hypothetical protein
MQGALVLERCSLHLHAQAECEGLHYEDWISQKIAHSISKNLRKVFGIELETIPQCDAKHEMYVM